MSKIFVVLGKSASGKDSIFKKLTEKQELNLQTVIGYTTRPIREGETDGVEYNFVDDNTLERLTSENKVIEHRAYHTVHGIWNYFTVNDGQIDLLVNNYIMIGTLESYMQIREYYGVDHIVPIYIEVEDGIRLERAMKREKAQPVPKYAEMCRRFLADEEDFCEEKLRLAGINKRYYNVNISQCINEISKDILETIHTDTNQ